MTSEGSLEAYYARRAHEYERIYEKLERQADLRDLQTFVASAFQGADVLEVACGTGYWTRTLAGVARSVLATDINDEVLALGRAKALDPTKVTFLRADAYALPPLSREVNAVLAAFWWSHIPKARIRPFLLSLHNALGTGAKVVFIDNVYVEGSSTPIARVDEHGDSYQIRRLAGGRNYEVLKNFPTEAELRASVSGLTTGVQVQFLQYYWVLSYFVADATPGDPTLDFTKETW